MSVQARRVSAILSAAARKRVARRLQDERVLRRASQLAGADFDLWFNGLSPPVAGLLRMLVRRQMQLALRGIEQRRLRRRRARRALIATVVFAALVARESARPRARRMADA
jgi:hypothetical protein